MGADGLGTASKMAIRKGSAWGTAVDLAANHRVPFVSCGMIHEPIQIEDETLVGASTPRPPVNGNFRDEGPLVILGDYRQHLLLEALLLGTAGVPADVDVGATYKHTLKWTPSVQGLFASLGIDKGGVKSADGSKKCEAWASVKPARMTLESAAGGAVRQTFDLLGAGYLDTEDASAWTFPAATTPVNGGGRTMVHARQVCRVNAAAGAGLGNGDKVYPNRIRITVERALARVYSQGTDIIEPVSENWQRITLALDFYTASGALLDLFRDAHLAETLLKCDLVYTYPKNIGATATPWSRAFYFPKLKVTRAPLEVPGPGALPFSVEMSAHLATAAPTGFPTGCVEEMREEWVNEIATDPLA